MIKKEDYINIGNTGRAHGLLGELACKLTVDIADWIADEEGRAFLMLEEHGLLIPFRIEGHRTKAGDVDLIKFAGLDSKEEAERWIGVPIWLAREVVDETEEGSPLDDYARLVGYQVFDAVSGGFVGEVVSVDQSTLNTLLILERTGGDELLLPLAAELIAALDEATRRLTLMIPEGLLTDEAEYDIH